MRMATLTLPMFDNDGAAIPAVHSAVQDKLLASFGGYSKSTVEGAWRDPETGRVYTDHNALYSIAMDDTADNRLSLRNVAIQAGIAAAQLAMMVTMPDGEVEFIDTSMRAAA